MFGLYARLAAVLLVAVFLAGTHWKAYTKGQDAINAEWRADIAQRTADALVASEKARQLEQELNKKVRNVQADYRAARANTDHIAVAAANGMRELEAILAKSTIASTGAGDTGGDDGDPRLDILAQCSSALVRLDKEARKLADQVGALQAVAPVLRLK